MHPRFAYSVHCCLSVIVLCIRHVAHLSTFQSILIKCQQKLASRKRRPFLHLWSLKTAFTYLIFDHSAYRRMTMLHYNPRVCYYSVFFVKTLESRKAGAAAIKVFLVLVTNLVDSTLQDVVVKLGV